MTSPAAICPLGGEGHICVHHLPTHMWLQHTKMQHTAAHCSQGRSLQQAWAAPQQPLAWQRAQWPLRRRLAPYAGGGPAGTQPGSPVQRRLELHQRRQLGRGFAVQLVKVAQVAWRGAAAVWHSPRKEEDVMGHWARTRRMADVRAVQADQVGVVVPPPPGAAEEGGCAKAALWVPTHQWGATGTKRACPACLGLM